LNLSPIDKDIVQQLKDVKYPKSWMENAAHHTQDERHRILEKKLFPILKNYYRSKKVKKTDEEIKKSVNGYVK
jgi:hypothetical protein